MMWAFFLQQSSVNLKIIRERIVSLAKDKKWCGLLNLSLEEGFSEQEIGMTLPEVLQFSGDLMWNQFGSQFVTKLFGACNEDQKTKSFSPSSAPHRHNLGFEDRGVEESGFVLENLEPLPPLIVEGNWGCRRRRWMRRRRWRRGCGRWNCWGG